MLAYSGVRTKAEKTARRCLADLPGRRKLLPDGVRRDEHQYGCRKPQQRVAISHNGARGALISFRVARRPG